MGLSCDLMFVLLACVLRDRDGICGSGARPSELTNICHVVPDVAYVGKQESEQSSLTKTSIG